MGEKGYLTEEDLNLALAKIMDHHDQTKIKKIFGVLNSAKAKIDLETFKEKVQQYSHEKDKETLENNNVEEPIIFNKNIHRNDAANRNSPFHPSVVSSPIDVHTKFNLHEDTFESTGEDVNTSIASDYEDVDNDFSFMRASRLRLSFRGSKKFSRKNSICSDSPSPTKDLEAGSSSNYYQEEHLRKQIMEKQLEISHYQENLETSTSMVKTLEEKIDNLENTNKELNYELDNSKVNIKNLEAHMIFLDEKLTNEAKDLNNQRNLLEHEREKLSGEKNDTLADKLKLEKQFEELEDWRNEILAANHILQAEIVELKKENKELAESYEMATKVRLEELQRLSLENMSLKQSLMVKKTEKVETKSEKILKCPKKPAKRQSILKILLTILLRSGLLCVHEVLVYLKFLIKS